MNTVTVTGASGHLGANLVRKLLERGFEVRALVRQSQRALMGLPVDIVKGDILDRASLAQAFEGAQTVYHLAAHISIRDGDWDRLEKVNIVGTLNVIEACRMANVATLVHFSSIHALQQQPLERPVDENNALYEGKRGLGRDYDLSKAAADRLVRAVPGDSLSTRIIYPTAVIGPQDYHGSLMGGVIKKICSGRLPALVSGGFDWVDARDVVEAAIEAADNGGHGERFMLSGHYRSMRQLADVVAEFSRVPAPRFSSPIWLARFSAPLMGLWARLAHEEPLYTRASLTALQANPQVSHAHAANRLSYRPRPFDDTIRDAVNFYRGAQLPCNT